MILPFKYTAVMWDIFKHIFYKKDNGMLCNDCRFPSVGHSASTL